MVKLNVLVDLFQIFGGLGEMSLTEAHFQRLVALGGVWLYRDPTDPDYPSIFHEKKAHDGLNEKPIEG